MTHDLFQDITNKYQIELKEVLIKDLQDGIFYASLVFNSGNTEQQIDSRPSDAIALALRADCPIFSTKDVLNKAGMTTSLTNLKQTVEKVTITNSSDFLDDLSSISKNKLEEILNNAIVSEDYELAARIRDELKKNKWKS
jgi:bifunctional DNase/RNase